MRGSHGSSTRSQSGLDRIQMDRRGRLCPEQGITPSIRVARSITVRPSPMAHFLTILSKCRTLGALSLLLGTLSGCLPKIGADCITDQDCSPAGDRLCDTTQPGGYCTIADCDSNTCPEKESVCVSFNTSRSTQGACENRSQPSPHRRNFCMALCDSSDDCRSGYACIDMREDNTWTAAVITEDPKGHKVCVLSQSHPDIDESRADDFCAVGVGGAGGASP